MKSFYILCGLVVIVFCKPHEPTQVVSKIKEPPKSQTADPERKPREPDLVTFPHAWTINGKLQNGDTVPVVRITVQRVESLGNQTLEKIGLRGIKADKGYKFIGVQYSMKYLLHEAWKGYKESAGLSLQLRTNRGNIYKGKGFAFAYFTRFRPEETLDRWEYFEIREEESPFSLEGLEHFLDKGVSQSEVARIWNL